MATMTLRVGSKQSRRNRSIHSERKEMCTVAVTSNHVDEARAIDEAEGTSVAAKIENLLSAATIEEQLDILKEVAKSHLGNGNLYGKTKVSAYCIQFLVDLYVAATPKSPFKSAVARILMTLPEEVCADVAVCLSTHLKKLMSSNGSLVEMNEVIVEISCCFDSFPVGMHALSLCVMPAMLLMKTCLQCCIMELSREVSPAKKMEVCKTVHSAVRTTVSLLQKCQTEVKQLVYSEGGCKEGCSVSDAIVNLASLLDVQCRVAPGSTDCSELEGGNCHAEPDIETYPAADTLSSLLALVAALMGYSDLPMDTHATCGMAFVLLAVLLEGTGGEWHKSLKNQAVPWKVDLSSDFCQLSVCSGVLNVLSIAELCDVHPMTGEPIINFVFRHLYDISKRTMADSVMVFGVSRALLLLSRNLLSTAVQLQDVTVVNGMLDFVWTHLEHYMDSVRHSASGILLNIVKLGSALQKDGLNGCNVLTTILETVMKIPVHSKARYIGLAILADEIGCQVLIKQIPDLVRSLFNSLTDPTLTTHVSCAVEHLMLQHRIECQEDTWRALWILPILELLSHASPSLCGPLQALLATAVSHNPQIVTHMLQPVTSDVHTKATHLRILLSCLHLARKQGALDGQSESQHHSGLWKGVLDFGVLKQALYHDDVEIRLSALSMLAESHRSTETFSVHELQLVKTFLEYNVNSEIPSSRQQTLSLLKKILTRLRDSSRALYCKTGQTKTRKKSESDSDEHHMLRAYNTFLLWLLKFSFANLFPGANFGRRVSSLQILTLCHEILRFDAAEPVWSPCPPIIYTKNYANTLLECLKDTYENNKLLAFQLLITFPAEALGLNDSDHVSSFIEVSLQLASSHSPPDCITAAYLLRVLVSFCQTGVVLAGMQDCAERGSSNYSTVYLAVRLLVRQLCAQLAEAECNILIAAASGPMYGTLFCIRQLLAGVNFMSIASERCWRSLIGEVVNLCFCLSKVVDPVVNSCSPEGHLPMDFEPGLQHQKKDLALDKSLLPVLNVTAQMVLLCAWRTVKEVSLFLGELSEQATISSTEDAEKLHVESLLTEKQVLAIGSHLAALLVETKHRGAFEQAYVGFCKLCSKLWRHKSPRLHNLPCLWLKEVMDTITWGKSTKLCATRRSAGLPFMVQALLTTELQVGSNTSCFQQSMAALLTLAESADNRAGIRRSTISAITDTATEESASIPADSIEVLCLPEVGSDFVSPVEARIHALNILRSLFRHSLLGESVTPYVAQGVIVAIQGFKAKTWAERNSATLLFSALVTRIFGVHRSRDELSIRNRMTGRIFFLRYPSLYDFLLEELKEAVTRMEKCYSTLRPALFPVLLLLSRLYPSSLEGTDSNLQLSVYAPFVHRCSLSTVLKTRVLAARALVPLVAPNQYPVLLQELVTISALKCTTENYRHGLLLQIFHLLHESLLVSTISKEVAEHVEQWIVSLKWLLPSESGFQICFVTSEVFLRILHIVSRRLFMSVSHSVWREIYHDLHLDLMRQQEFVPSSMIGRGMYMHRAVQLLLELLLALHPSHIPTAQFLKDMEQLVVLLLHHESYTVVNVALSFLEAVLNAGDYLSEDEKDSTLLMNDDFFRYVKEWDRNHEGALATWLRSSVAVGEILIQQVIHKQQNVFAECYWRTFCVLSHCPSALLRVETGAEAVLKDLLQRCQKEYEGVGWTVLRCAGSLVKVMQQENVCTLPAQTPPSTEVASELCHTLTEFSSAEKCLTCRLTVANILLDNLSWLQGTVTFLSVLDVCILWTVVMTLMDDDCAHVRELISSLATQMKCTKLPVMPQRARELLIEYFVCMMMNVDTLMCVVCLVAWCLGPTTSDCDSEVLEDRVFDKGEMNVFAETAILVEVVCCQLKSILCKEDGAQLLKTHLPEKLKHWLLDMCCPDVSTELYGEETFTLAEFIKAAERKATFSTGDSHFMFKNSKTEHLTAYKTNKLLEAVCGALETQ